MSSNPLPFPVLDAERFRRELAGLVDEEQSGDYAPDDFKDQAAMLVFCLARLYNRDVLEPIKLWERISSGIAAACEKVDDGDLDRFISICLEHIKATHTRAATDVEALPLIGAITEQDESWRLGFVTYLKSHSYTAIIHGRRLWDTRKEHQAS